MNARKHRTRATALPGNGIGDIRHALYKAGHERIRGAMKHGYHLEAISLIESLMTDRLESRLTFLVGENISFQNLGPLLDLMRKHEPDAVTLAYVVEHVDAWRRTRNAAAHEMLKIEVGDSRAWDTRLSELRGVAADGYRVLQGMARLLDRGRPRRSMR